jgi:hypothetical protein
VEVSRSHEWPTPSHERGNYGDKMNTISHYWNDMVGGYHWIHQEDFNATFDADVKSNLTVSNNQKSQNWNCNDRNLTKSWLPMWKKTLSGFQQFIQEPQPVNELRVMIFGRWRGCWKLHFCTYCSIERKINSGAVQLGFAPWDEYQKLGELSYPSIGYLFSLIQLTV